MILGGGMRKSGLGQHLGGAVGGMRPQGMLGAAQRMLGHSPMGGTPPKDKSSAPAVPHAPSLSSRTKPGTVPMRTRGRK